MDIGVDEDEFHNIEKVQHEVINHLCSNSLTGETAWKRQEEPKVVPKNTQQTPQSSCQSLTTIFSLGKVSSGRGVGQAETPASLLSLKSCRKISSSLAKSPSLLAVTGRLGAGHGAE